MAIYHCSCKVISRGQGRSAVGAAAYRSGEILTNDYDGLTHDYTKKSGVVYSEIMLCENAPLEFQNRSILWNEVERIEKGSRAQLAREYEIALPVELNREEQIQLVRNFVKDNFVDKGMCADVAIHDKEDGNPHAHIMLTTRPIERDGNWGAKATNDYVLDKNGNRILQSIDKQNRKIYKRIKTDTTDWNKKEFLQRSRSEWAASINCELEKKKLPQRVDHRSLKEQGKAQIPTEHLGVAAKHIEQRGEVSRRGEVNREIEKANGKMREINYLQKQTQKEITFIREDMAWNKYHEQIAGIESTLPTIEQSEKALKGLQVRLEQLYEKAQSMKPSKASEGRTVEYDLRQIPYFEYHRNKLIADVASIKERVQNSLSVIEAQRQETAKPEQAKTAYEKLQEKQGRTIEQPQQRQSISPAFDVTAAARQLAGYRAAFVKAYEQAQNRTAYQENPIYRQQAVQITDLARRVQEQTASIKTLQGEKDALGAFKGKEKKVLQEKIDNFSRLLRGNVTKLEALGVSDPAKADEAVKEKNALAAEERRKAEVTRQNVGAADRAEEAKTAFIDLARSVPDSLRQEVAEQIKQTEAAEPESVGERLSHFKAEAEARRQLDTELKPEQGQQRQHEQTRTRWDER